MHTPDLWTLGPDTQQLYLLLAFAFMFLTGPMIMPAATLAARALPRIVVAGLLALGRTLLARLIEVAIVAALALGGGLWILDFVPVVLR